MLDECFPYNERRHDLSYQKLDFYLNIYFAVFPVHEAVDRNHAQVRLEVLG